MVRACAGGAYRGKSTNYDGFGPIVSGCGVPAHCYDLMMKDKESPLLYVALNSRKGDGGMGMFEEGKQCGRWLKVTLGKNCKTNCEHDDVDPGSAYPLVSRLCIATMLSYRSAWSVWLGVRYTLRCANTFLVHL